jgi:hypothetical protein
MDKYLIINEKDKKSFIIRTEFQKALLTSGLFVEIVDFETNIVIEENANKHRIEITDLELPYVREIWRVELEKSIEGLSTSSKTPEIALLVLSEAGENRLKMTVVLVELKSSLQDSKLGADKKPKQSTLQQCLTKFQAAMNRLYMLVSIRDYDKEKSFQNHTIGLVFKGVICFNKDETSKPDTTALYPILKKTASNLLTCNTLLSDKDKISIYFYEKRNIISLMELLR